MATEIIWPDALPIPLEGSYTITSEDHRVSSTMDAGQHIRLEFPVRVMDCTCRLRMMKTQAAAFETFFEDTLDMGAEWFRFPLYYGGSVRSYLVQFIELPEAKNVGGVWTLYSFHLKASHKSAQLYGDADAFYNRLHYILHTLAPQCTTWPTGGSL